MDGVIAFILAILIALGVGLLLVTTNEHDKVYKTWVNQCNQVGGTVQHYGSNRSECFKDGKLITVPGWEGF